MAKQAGSNGDSKSSQTDPSDGQADALRRGWLTGYAYNACRSLYFERYKLDKGFNWETWDNLPNEDKKKQENEKKKLTGLLVYLNTYHSLADSWNVDQSHKKMIENMIRNVEEIWKEVNKKTPVDLGKRKKLKHEVVAIEEFDALFHSIEGIAGAENQLSYYAMDFSGCANALDNQKRNRVPELVKEVEDKLLNLKNFLSGSSYSVVEFDIEQIRRDAEAKDGGEDFKKDKRRTWDWSDLILGTRSVKEILNDKGKSVLHGLVALFGVLIFLVLFLFIGVVFNYLPDILSFLKISFSSASFSNIGDFISTLSTIIGILTGVGAALALLAQKTWNFLKSLEIKIAVLIASQCMFRAVCQKLDFQNEIDETENS